MKHKTHPISGPDRPAIMGDQSVLCANGQSAVCAGGIPNQLTIYDLVAGHHRQDSHLPCSPYIKPRQACHHGRSNCTYDLGPKARGFALTCANGQSAICVCVCVWEGGVPQSHYNTPILSQVILSLGKTHSGPDVLK